MSDWEVVGTVPVDAGLCALVDPCRDPDLLAAIDDIIASGGQFVCLEDFEGREVGVVAEAGMGDGVYPVWVRYEELEGLGHRVAEVRVVFLEENPDDGWTDTGIRDESGRPMRVATLMQLLGRHGVQG